eukprot:g7146.t1
MPGDEASIQVRSLFRIAHHRGDWRDRAGRAVSDALFDYSYGSKPGADAESRSTGRRAKQALLGRVGVGLNPVGLSIPPLDLVLRRCLLPKTDPEHGYVVTDNWGKSVFLLCCRYGLVAEARKVWETFGSNAPNKSSTTTSGASSSPTTSEGEVNNTDFAPSPTCNSRGLKMLREAISFDATRRKNLLTVLEILAIAKYTVNESACDCDTNDFLASLVENAQIRQQVLLPRLAFQMRKKLPTFLHFWTRYECDGAVRAALVVLAELEKALQDIAEEPSTGVSKSAAEKAGKEARILRTALYEYGCGPAITKIDSSFEDMPEDFARRGACLDVVGWRLKFKEDCGLPTHAGSFVGMRALQRAMEAKKWVLAD